jgi:hypothetical protein
MGESPTEHGRPPRVSYLKRTWADFLLVLQNKWTWRLLCGLLKILIWIARKFDWF